jgi:hypothetical protein
MQHPEGIQGNQIIRGTPESKSELDGDNKDDDKEVEAPTTKTTKEQQLKAFFGATVQSPNEADS